MERKGFQFSSFWTRHSGGMALAVVVLVAFVGFLLDRLLVHEGVSRVLMLVVSNTITGIVAGGLFFQAAKHERAQRAFMRERMRMIAELNHHIRNALQVIKLCEAQTGPGKDSRALQLIKESADRIEWALREVLPKYPVNADSISRQPPVGYAAVSSPMREDGPFSDRASERNHTIRLH